MKSPSVISRRRLLQGAGVALGLPWLESVPAWGATTATAASPRRFAVLFMGCGVNPKQWWAKGAGSAMELGPSLEPMAPLRAKMNYFDGLNNSSAIGPGIGIHPSMTGQLLSGASLGKGPDVRAGITMDQLIAKRIGQDCELPSLVLACEAPATGYNESNYSLVYSSHISWESETVPVPVEQYPALAFDSLVGNKEARRTLSVLDRVRDQASQLMRDVGQADREKLGEYFESVREVEQRLRRRESVANKRPITAADMARPSDGVPGDLRTHIRLMCDIIALALQTDKTRVASLIMCRDLSGFTYPWMNIRTAHHLASHSDNSDDYHRITRFYCEQYAYLAGKLDAMKEGDRSVLDNSCLMFINNMWSGGQHESARLPILTVGSLGGALKTGRVLDYRKAPDANRRVCGLYRALMEKIGAHVDHFGDADKPLDV